MQIETIPNALTFSFQICRGGDAAIVQAELLVVIAKKRKKSFASRDGEAKLDPNLPVDPHSAPLQLNLLKPIARTASATFQVGLHGQVELFICSDCMQFAKPLFSS